VEKDIKIKITITENKKEIFKMSAFIVNKKHIDYIVTVLYNDNPLFTKEFLNKTGQTLVDENFKSVNYRYNESNQPYKYIFEQVRNINPIQVLKAINCLDYQSCEHNTWKRSNARKILDDIRDICINKLPGYDDFQWEVR